jgi:hypothetical protein
MNTFNFNCTVGSTNPKIPLGLEIWLNDHKFFDQEHIDIDHAVEYEINDADGEHELRFVLKNKLPEHTTVDAQGSILNDVTITINGIRFDDIDCDYLVSTVAEYKHDFNGTSEPTTQSFYGEMGCNGTVTLKFSTPIYIWLLENM